MVPLGFCITPGKVELRLFTLPTVRVAPPAELFVTVPLPVNAPATMLNVFMSIVPELRLKVPLPVVFNPIWVVPDDIVTLLKVAEVPPMDCVVPAKITVLEFEVNVPLFVQFPLTVKEFEALIVNVALALIVILLQMAPAAPIVG